MCSLAGKWRGWSLTIRREVIFFSSFLAHGYEGTVVVNMVLKQKVHECGLYAVGKDFDSKYNFRWIDEGDLYLFYR